LSLEHWETYYRGGALATGPTGADGAYDQETRAGWAAFFASLPDGARLLDIGTGNGVIPMMARESAVAAGKKLEIDATDLAAIAPLRDVPDAEQRLAGVRFHPGVANERLPFEAGCLHAVSGHYALEYGDMAATLAEVGRVLRPGGLARFVLHHAESVLVGNAHGSLAEADFVLSELKLYRKLRRVVTMEATSTDAVNRAADELRTAIRQLKQALASARVQGRGLILDVTLDATQKLLVARTQGTPAEVEREIDGVEGELRASVRRLKDLVGRALDAAAMAALVEQARAVGFVDAAAAPELHAGDHLVGWRLEMRKP
jgi:SAM-dependent methyltransferase